jgi:LacI family transcriptional regulator
VSPEETERIQKIAKQLGYRPNPLVAALTAQVRTYRRNPQPATIAMLDCWPRKRPSWANFSESLDYIDGVRDRADALGYQIDLIRLVDLENSLERLKRLLVTRAIHGLLVLPVPEGTDLRGFDFSGIACSTIDYSLQQPVSIRRASPHYYHNTLLALDTLVERGYRRIGYVATPVTRQRQDDLCLAAFLAFGSRHPKTCVSPCYAQVPTRQRELSAWLRRNRPDALITNDFLLPDDIVQAGFRVPEDLAAVMLSCPNDPSRHVTHIDENYREVGAQAVDTIVDAIHRNEYGLPTMRVAHLVDGCWQEGRTVRLSSSQAEVARPSRTTSRTEKDKTARPRRSKA